MAFTLSIVILLLVPVLIWAMVIAGLCLIVRDKTREKRS